LNNFILIITLSFYILFLIPSFLIHPHKLFSMQLGPGTASLVCARLIVPFALFNVPQDLGQLHGINKLRGTHSQNWNCMVYFEL